MTILNFIIIYSSYFHLIIIKFKNKMTFIIIFKILFNFLTFVFAVKESASEDNL